MNTEISGAVAMIVAMVVLAIPLGRYIGKSLSRRTHLAGCCFQSN